MGNWSGGQCWIWTNNARGGGVTARWDTDYPNCPRLKRKPPRIRDTRCSTEHGAKRGWLASGCGGWTCTTDLQLMGLASCFCSTPRKMRVLAHPLVFRYRKNTKLVCVAGLEPATVPLFRLSYTHKKSQHMAGRWHSTWVVNWNEKSPDFSELLCSAHNRILDNL